MSVIGIKNSLKGLIYEKSNRMDTSDIFCRIG